MRPAQVHRAPQQEVEAILPDTIDLAQCMPQQIIKIEITGESVDTGVAGVFESSPLTISRPFTPGEQVADAMVLLSDCQSQWMTTGATRGVSHYAK